MKIALIGYGKMGKEVENLISEDSSHQVISVSYIDKNDGLDKDGIKKADVAIDFTSPNIVIDTIKAVLPLGTKMVVGTSAWYDRVSEVKALVKKYKGGLIYGPNFSIGANIFFQIVGVAAKLLSTYGSYDVAGFEMHHSGKKDSPSGTAKKLAEIIMENFPRKKTLQTERLDRQIQKDELHFASLRLGRYFGEHKVMFDSAADEITLVHLAHNRRGFAEGALMAAEFIKGKKGLYMFEELFKEGKLK